MTASQVDGFLEQIVQLNGVTTVCAEGGEPFTRYDVMLHAVRQITHLGLSASALTNASWVTSERAAEQRISELQGAGLTHLGVSTDEWHRRYIPVARVEMLLRVCKAAGLTAARMETSLGGVMFRGRAAERLAPGMPTRAAEELTTCPHEQLATPSRIHLDCYGRLHLCQGLNVGTGELGEAIGAYDGTRHPIVARLLNGGPYALARYAAELGFDLAPEYVDACHLCYRAREFLRPRFPDLLGPDEMYGS